MMEFRSPTLPRVLRLVACLTLIAASSVRAQAPADPVGAAIAGMKSGDRERVVAGRQELLNQLRGHPDDKMFLANYARQLSVELAPIVDGNDPHAKLNAAIVIGRIADLTGSADLANVTAKLIHDPSPAIATFGLRASANLLPRILADVKAAPSNVLVPAIIDAVTKNPQSESVAFEAYNAMTRVLLDTRGAAQLLGTQVINDATPRTVDAVHQLLALRLTMMGHNELAEPAAEQTAINFLGRQTTWQLSTPAQQLKTIAALIDCASGAVAELDSIPAAQQQSAARERAQALRSIFKSSAQSLSVIAELLGKAELKTTAQQYQQLGAATPVAEYKRVAGSIQADFSKAYPDLKLTNTIAQTQPAAPAVPTAPTAPSATP